MTFKSYISEFYSSLIQFRVSNLWTVPRRDFWLQSGQPSAKPKNTRGAPKFFISSKNINISYKYHINISVKKGLVNWSSSHACFHAWYIPLVWNAWLNAKDLAQTLGNGFLFAVCLFQILTLTQIQVKYFVSLLIWRKIALWDLKSRFPIQTEVTSAVRPKLRRKLDRSYVAS